MKTSETTATTALDETDHAQKRVRLALEREALKVRLIDEGENALALKLGKCGEELPLVCTCCGETKIVETRCDQKWCPSCAPALAARTVERYRGLCADARWPLFVTFTVKSYDDDDDGAVRDVRRAFGRLRRLRWWKRCVAGGVAGIELKRGKRGLHPHVHALLDCQWLAVTITQPPRHCTKEHFAAIAKLAAVEVAEQWSLAARRKGSVKIRRVWRRDGGDPAAAAREVLKYSITSETLLDDPRPVGPLIRQLRATRLITSSGSFFGHPANKRKKLAGKACPHCHSLGAWLPEKFVPR